MCFVVFCGVLWCFAGVLWCFAGVLRCFASVLQYFHKTRHTRKTSKNTEKQKKLTIRSCIAGVFKEQKNRLYCTKHPSQNICKTPQTHRKHNAKQSQNAFCEITSQNTAKQTQNAQNCHKAVIIQLQYVLRAFGVYFKNTLDLSQKYTMRNTRKLRGWGVSRTPAGGHGFSKTQCVAVFCGVLRCFAVFCGVLCACF